MRSDRIWREQGVELPALWAAIKAIVEAGTGGLQKQKTNYWTKNIFYLLEKIGYIKLSLFEILKYLIKQFYQPVVGQKIINYG